MPVVTFQILDGIDKGRIFRELPTPVTIGREDGNVLRLNDERVSRFHAKVQVDNGEVIITDLDSTNGTRVNGNVVQIRRLRPGDRVHIGRSLLLFGSEQEIQARSITVSGTSAAGPATNTAAIKPGTVPQNTLAASIDADLDIDLNVTEPITFTRGELFLGNKQLPPLPQKMSPSQGARLAELLDFLHKQLTNATEGISASDDLSRVNLSYSDWQRILNIQMLLARYLRAVSEPDILDH
ncbi:MAG: FHA domain-containing protein [Gemmataceae bacterium]